MNSSFFPGESYIDCCERVSPVLIEMEECDNLVIVAHQAILRCVFGYLFRKPVEDIPYVKIPQHTIMQVRGIVPSQALGLKLLGRKRTS